MGTRTGSRDAGGVTPAGRSPHTPHTMSGIYSPPTEEEVTQGACGWPGSPVM
jgi:hypothetical protein